MELQLLMILLTRATELGIKIQEAQAEGRELTSEELEEFRNGLLESEQVLEEAIQRAKAEGR